MTSHIKHAVKRYFSFMPKLRSVEEVYVAGDGIFSELLSVIAMPKRSEAIMIVIAG